MTNKVIMSICVDTDLIDIVNELKARRHFSRFIQDCLRSHQGKIESESLEHEKAEIETQIKELIARQSFIENRIQEVKIQEIENDSINVLATRLIQLNNDKLNHDWGNIPVHKWPKKSQEWHFERLKISDKLKQSGFDFSKLKGGM